MNAFVQSTVSEAVVALAEEAHARLSPSGSKKWMACPGSITLEAPIPNEPSEHSDKGTAMHDVAAWCLDNEKDADGRIGDYIVVSLPHEKLRKVHFTEDMADLTQGYVNACRFLMKQATRSWVEKRVNFSEFVMVPGQFGTCDFAALIDLGDLAEFSYELLVMDLKSGYREVRVHKNTQAMLYALGVLAMLRDEYMPGVEAFSAARAVGIKQVRLAIYQPRIHGEKAVEEVMTLDELEASVPLFRSKACSVENAARDYRVIPVEQWNATYLNQTPNDEECAFCRAMPICPTANKTLEEFMMDGFEKVVDGLTTPAGHVENHLDATANRVALLNKLMKAAPFVEDMIKAVRSETERALLAGEELPDFGLDTGRAGNRHFKDDEEAEHILNKQMRLSREHIYTRKLKTPTQLEKLTKPGKNEETGAVEKAVIGPTQWMRIVKLVTQNEASPTVKPKSQIKKPYTPPKPSVEDFEAVEAADDEEQLY